MLSKSRMNRLYRLVWSVVRSCWVVISEKGSAPIAQARVGCVTGSFDCRTKSVQSFFYLILCYSTTVVAQLASPVTPLVNLPVLASGGAPSGVTVQSSGTQMQVQQSNARSIVNWNQFSVANGHSVEFQQLNPQSILVNRVVGSGLQNGLTQSIINGTVTANGQIWLLNPAGTLIGPSGTISAHGFMATTRQMQTPDNEFLGGTGQFRFAGVDAGQIINQGSIVTNGGYGILAGAQVRNELGAQIIARLGKVVLAGADSFTFDLNGDGLLNFAVPSAQAASVLTGNLNQVVQSGIVSVDGGHVLITAKGAAEVLGAVINTTGLVQANAVSLPESQGGGIVLGHVEIQGDGATDVFVTGQVSASGSVSMPAVSLVGRQVVVGQSGLEGANNPENNAPVSTNIQKTGTAPSSIVIDAKEFIRIENGAQIQSVVMPNFQFDLLESSSSSISTASGVPAPVNIRLNSNMDISGGASTLQSKGGIEVIGGSALRSNGGHIELGGGLGLTIPDILEAGATSQSRGFASNSMGSGILLLGLGSSQPSILDAGGGDIRLYGHSELSSQSVGNSGFRSGVALDNAVRLTTTGRGRIDVVGLFDQLPVNPVFVNSVSGLSGVRMNSANLTTQNGLIEVLGSAGGRLKLSSTTAVGNFSADRNIGVDIQDSHFWVDGSLGTVSLIGRGGGQVNMTNISLIDRLNVSSEGNHGIQLLRSSVQVPAVGQIYIKGQALAEIGIDGLEVSENSIKTLLPDKLRLKNNVGVDVLSSQLFVGDKESLLSMQQSSNSNMDQSGQLIVQGQSIGDIHVLRNALPNQRGGERVASQAHGVRIANEVITTDFSIGTASFNSASSTLAVESGTLVIDAIGHTQSNKQDTIQSASEAALVLSAGTDLRVLNGKLKLKSDSVSISGLLRGGANTTLQVLPKTQDRNMALGTQTITQDALYLDASALNRIQGFGGLLFGGDLDFEETNYQPVAGRLSVGRVNLDCSMEVSFCNMTDLLNRPVSSATPETRRFDLVARQVQILDNISLDSGQEALLFATDTIRFEPQSVVSLQGQMELVAPKVQFSGGKNNIVLGQNIGTALRVWLDNLESAKSSGVEPKAVVYNMPFNLSARGARLLSPEANPITFFLASSAPAPDNSSSTDFTKTQALLSNLDGGAQTSVGTALQNVSTLKQMFVESTPSSQIMDSSSSENSGSLRQPLVTTGRSTDNLNFENNGNESSNTRFTGLGLPLLFRVGLPINSGSVMSINQNAGLVTKPPTPKDEADFGDATLALVAVADLPKPVAHSRRSPARSLTVNIAPGLNLKIEEHSVRASGVPTLDQRFSLSGNLSRW